jgi:hypothetical protein
LLFLIFLVSILVLEAILRHDAAQTRRIKRLPTVQTPPLKPEVDAPNTDTSNVLTLAKAIEQHSREARRPMSPQSARATPSGDYSSDPAVTPVAPTGSRPLK